MNCFGGQFRMDFSEQKTVSANKICTSDNASHNIVLIFSFASMGFTSLFSQGSIYEKYIIAWNDRPYIRIENMSFWFFQVPTMVYWFRSLVSRIHLPCFVHSPKLYSKNYTHVSISIYHILGGTAVARSSCSFRRYSRNIAFK